MSKLTRQLILVWSIVCASGLGIFLFQIYAPALTPQTAYDGRDLITAVAFFALIWLLPVAVVIGAGFRRKE